MLFVSTWETSAATPGAPRISYSESWVTFGSSLSKSESGWPIPPPAPSTTTLEFARAELLNARVEDEAARRALRESMVVVVVVRVTTQQQVESRRVGRARAHFPDSGRDWPSRAALSFFPQAPVGLTL